MNRLKLATFVAVLCVGGARAATPTLPEGYYDAITTQSVDGVESQITWHYVTTTVKSGRMTLSGVKLCGIDGLLIEPDIDLPKYFNPAGSSITVSVIEYDSEVFAGQDQLESVTIPDTVRKIGDGAFLGCSCLSSVALGSGVMTLGDYVFEGCPTLQNIDVTANTHFVFENECLYSSDRTILYFCDTYASDVTLPDELEEIRSSAFYDCIAITNLVIPASVTSIGEYALNVTAYGTERKAQLQDVTFLGEDPDAIVITGGLYDYAPTDLTTYASGDKWKAKGTSWQGRTLVVNGEKPLQEELTYISGTTAWTFTTNGLAATITGVRTTDGSALKAVSFPDTISSFIVTTIGKGICSNHLALTSVTIPYTVTTLEDNPIAGCPFVTTLTIATGNPAYAMDGDLLLTKDASTLVACLPAATELTLAETIKRINSDAFVGCNSLTTLTFKGDEPQVDTTALLADTPASLTVKADAYVYSWGDPLRTTWQNRTFTNTGTAAPAGTQTADDTSGNTWSYEIYNRCATITRLTTSKTDVTIPATLDGWPVTNIASTALQGCTTITNFAVASDNTAYAAKYGMLYTKDMKTLVKIPAGFQFAADVTAQTKTTTYSVIEVYNGIDPTNKLLLANTLITNDTPTVVSSVDSGVLTQNPTMAIILAGVTRIADRAFANCGFAPESLTNTASTATKKICGLYQKKTAWYETIVTTETTYDYDCPRPTIASGVTCPDEAWIGSYWYEPVTTLTLANTTPTTTVASYVDVLASAADPKLAANIKTQSAYDAFCAWAAVVKNASGETAGEEAVLRNASAWTAYALNASALPQSALTATSVKIENMTIDGNDGAISFTLSVDNLFIGSQATEDRIKSVITIMGSSSVSGPFSSCNGETTFATPANGKVQAFFVPTSASNGAFFMKARLR